VEHRDGDRVRAFGLLADAFPHAATLVPFRRHLVHAGVGTGQLVLIEEATGREVARLAVRRPDAAACADPVADGATGGPATAA
jgi:hypothetical protein